MDPVGIELINLKKKKNMSGNEAVSHSTGSPDTCCSDRILRMRDEVLGNIEISAISEIESLPIEPTSNRYYVHVYYTCIFLNRTYQIITYHKHISYGTHN